MSFEAYGVNISDSRICFSAIAKNLLIGETGSPSVENIEDRTKQVSLFLESMGGMNWYKNYSKEFALPTGGEEYVAQERGISDSKLGYYYTCRNLTSGDNLL